MDLYFSVAGQGQTQSSSDYDQKNSISYFSPALECATSPQFIYMLVTKLEGALQILSL